jgi:hypothetical protein
MLAWLLAWDGGTQGPDAEAFKPKQGLLRLCVSEGGLYAHMQSV